MKKFPYPMKRVHDARVALLNRCEALLAEAERNRLISQQRKEQCVAEIKKHAATSYATGQHDASKLLHERIWFKHLMQQLDQAIHHHSEQEETVTEKRNSLNKALQNCKIIENLTQRQKKVWVYQELKAEQQEQDENATLAFARKRQGFVDPGKNKPFTTTEETL